MTEKFVHSFSVQNTNNGMLLCFQGLSLSPQFNSVLYFLNCPLRDTGHHGSSMWPIMSFLYQDLILYNWTPTNLPVTIIFSHSSDVLFLFTDHAVQPGMWCIMFSNVGNSINGRHVFRLITECSYE